MIMAKKTFKLGEYCKGGLITVETTSSEIHIITKEWDISSGYNINSNQSKAKELYRKTFNISSNNLEMDLFFYLSDETSSYYADEIIKWIKSKIKKLC